MKRISVVVDNSLLLAVDKPLKQRLRGDDEIAHLDKSFHLMAHSLRESARKERAVIQNARDVICSLSSDYKFIAVNPAARAVIGYEPDELTGKRAVDLICSEDREKSLKIFDSIASQKTADCELENRLTHKDGRLVDALWSLHWSAEEKSIFCVVHDISERKQIDRLKQEFVAMVSHDLRTPLSSVKGTLSLLSEGVYDARSDAGQTRLAVAQQSIDRLIHLINDLLDIEKMEAGMLSMEFADTDVRVVVNAAVESVADFARQGQVALKSDVPEMAVLGDQDRLIQVVINLLSNAIKFSPAGSTVQITCQEADDKFAELRVKDQARGVPAAARTTIFERFKQVEHADGKRSSGTGLGLAICRAIVQAHHGAIGVDGEEGCGSTFWIRVPLAAPMDRPTPSDIAQKSKR